ncbi:MAG: GTP-binding protein [Thermoplasmata archaeon]|nr:MAG: GTP-binding protein [Thermoplasmata archaeon]
MGKTSLIQRFVYDMFDDSYSNTIGTHVTKKEVKIKHPEDKSELDVYLLIWDLMGQQCFLHMLRESYFFGCAGLIAVCDVTRKKTLDELPGWLSQAITVTGDVPIVILGNKSDLEGQKQLNIEDIENFASGYKDAVGYLSSVKTGYNVEHTFDTLCERMLKKTL